MPSATLCPVCSAENPLGASLCGTCGTPFSPDGSAAINALPPGTTLRGGAYTVGKVLGQGGFGITYLGSETRLRRPVAIKEFFPHGSGRRGKQVVAAGAMEQPDFQAAREKFEEEARLLARFRHPGIVAVYDTFQEHGTAYVVMCYLRGRSLEALLAERGPLPEQEAIGYVAQACEALAVVHRAGLLHRDLKPENLFLTEDESVVLIDFGSVRAFASGKTRRMTTLLTPGYAPLEQYGQQARFGPFTDVYALGATLYHLVTGQVPTQATDRAIGAPLPAPRALNPAVSAATSDAILRAMAMRVDERPQSVAELLEALRRGRSADRRGSRPPPPRTAAPPPAPPRAASSEIELIGPRITWPARCACCLAHPDSSLRVEHTGSDVPFFLFQETRSWDIPYCAGCLRHVRARDAGTNGRAIGRAAGGAGIVAAVAAWVASGVWLEGIGIGLIVWLAVVGLGRAYDRLRERRLRSLLSSTCCAVGPAVSYSGWVGDLHRFGVANREYLAWLRRANGGGAEP